MAASEKFNGSDTSSGRRWIDLDAEVLSSACRVDIGPDATVGNLRGAALQSFYEKTRERDLSSWGRQYNVTQISVADPATDREIDPEISLESAGIEDGDLLVLRIYHWSSNLYSLGPAPNPQRLFSSFELLQSSRGAALPRDPHFAGVLLYTDADVELATFVRSNFDELNALSGSTFTIFIAERPERWAAAKRYWRPRLDQRLYRSMAALQWLRWVPYEKHLAPEIARRLGVPVSNIPCLVLFNSIHDEKKFVFPIDSASPTYFRTLFHELSKVLNIDPPTDFDFGAVYDRTRYSHVIRVTKEGLPFEDIAQKEAQADAVKRLAAAEGALHQELRKVATRDSSGGDSYSFHGFHVNVVVNKEGGPVSDQFNFHATTTFVNRPINTVISDFQNSYGAVQDSADLAALLRLILSSRDLTDSDKDEAARLVHEAAEKAEESSPKAVRSRLTAIKEIVAKAADIAAPALEITAKVIGALGQ
jgi:hypothetical protein